MKALHITLSTLGITMMVIGISMLIFDHERVSRQAFEAGAYYGAQYVWENGCDHLPSMTAREEACDQYMARQ